MKKLFLFITATLVGGAAIAQSATRQGNVIIDPYVGFPNWANSILFNDAVNWVEDNESEFRNVSNEKTVGGQLSYGGRVEYMLAEKFGAGLDFNYEASGIQFDYSIADSVWNGGTGEYDVTVHGPYNYKYISKKLRVMARLNFHFVQNERVDAYFGVGAGYKNVSREVTSNEPGFVDDSSGELIPVTLRLAVGTRIYFTENIGLNLELGAFGGALVQAGLSAKF